MRSCYNTANIFTILRLIIIKFSVNYVNVKIDFSNLEGLL